MKDSHLINYDIFARRTKFSLRNYLKKNISTTYEEFANMMRARKVCPPLQDIFAQIKNEVQLEIVPVITEHKSEVVDDIKKEVKPEKRTRRSRKKKTESNE